MNSFLTGAFRLLAWITIFVGFFLAGPGKSKLAGEALVALGFSALTTIAFISRRIKIYSSDSFSSELSAEKTPLSFMVVLTALFLISCLLVGLAISDFVRHGLSAQPEHGATKPPMRVGAKGQLARVAMVNV
jgi:hypothetical protein